MPPSHIHDDDLDLYAMRRFYAVDRKAIEEHLILCRDCQRRLAALETLIDSLRRDREERGKM